VVAVLRMTGGTLRGKSGHVERNSHGNSDHDIAHDLCRSAATLFIRRGETMRSVRLLTLSELSFTLPETLFSFGPLAT
jgi:hypothetical protein